MKRIAILAFLALLVAGGIGALAVGIWPGRGASPAPDPAPGHDTMKTLDGRIVSEKGTLEYPNAAGHPGDPEEAVKDFKRIYAAMDAYRRQHGRLPSPHELREVSKPLVEGVQLTKDEFRNPDWRYAERPEALAGKEPPNGPYAFNYFGPRPDGTPKPAFPKSGDLDVWMFSTLNAKSNTVLYPDGSRDTHFSGVFVVLFSDGSIRKFKHKEMFLVENANLPGPSYGYPGMTGYTKKAYDWEDSPANKPWEKHRVTYED